MVCLYTNRLAKGNWASASHCKRCWHRFAFVLAVLAYTQFFTIFSANVSARLLLSLQSVFSYWNWSGVFLQCDIATVTSTTGALYVTVQQKTSKYTLWKLADIRRPQIAVRLSLNEKKKKVVLIQNKGRFFLIFQENTAYMSFHLARPCAWKTQTDGCERKSQCMVKIEIGKCYIESVHINLYRLPHFVFFLYPCIFDLVKTIFKTSHGWLKLSCRVKHIAWINISFLRL